MPVTWNSCYYCAPFFLLLPVLAYVHGGASEVTNPSQMEIGLNSLITLSSAGPRYRNYLAALVSLQRSPFAVSIALKNCLVAA